MCRDEYSLGGTSSSSHYDPPSYSSRSSDSGFGTGGSQPSYSEQRPSSKHSAFGNSTWGGGSGASSKVSSFGGGASSGGGGGGSTWGTSKYSSRFVTIGTQVDIIIVCIVSNIIYYSKPLNIDIVHVLVN